MEDLEKLLTEPVSEEKLKAALAVRSTASFFRYRKGSKAKLDSGELTIGEVIDEIMWRTGYNGQIIANAILRLLDLDGTDEKTYHLALWIGHVSSNRRKAMNGNDRISIEWLNEPRLLQSLRINHMSTIDEVLDRIHDGDGKYITKDGPNTYIQRTTGLLYYTFQVSQ